MRRADLRLPPGRSAMSRVALTALALGALTALPVGCQREPAPSATSGSAGRTGAPGAATAGVDAPVTHEPPPASDTPPGSSPPAGEVARRPDPSAPGAPPADATSGEPAHADAATRDGTATAGISWHHDDYEAARAIAKAEGKPLVLDLWAPWCHTCLSMKHTVLRAPGLAPYADRFVWLAIDTDRPANDAVMKAFPIVFWPTFFVVDPEDGSVQARLQGGAPEETFRAFLDQGRAAVADKRRDSGRLDEDTPLYHLRDAEQLVTAGKLEPTPGR